MNLFEEAMSLEISMEEYYRHLIEDCNYNPEIKKILCMLVEDTNSHINSLRNMNQFIKAEPNDSDFFLKAKEIFHSLQEKKKYGICNLDQIEAYENVRVNLKKTIALYEEMITNTHDDRQSEIITLIFNEKRKHVYLLDNIIELLLHPEQWVENGEFNHMEAY